MRKENELVIEVLKENPVESEKILNSGNLDFFYLKNALLSNLLLPAFLYNSKRLNLLGKIPFKSAWSRDFNRNFIRNVKLSEVFCQIYRLAKKSGIDVLPLKGINLITFIYPHPGMRPLVDIDVYCRRRDFVRFKHLLLENGFVLNKADEIQAGKISCNFARVDKWAEPHIFVEVHVQLCPARPYSVELDLFKRKKEIDGIGYLGEEDLFINLLLKIRRDSHSLKLLYFYDLFTVMGKGNLDWDYVFDACKRNGIGRVLSFALSYVHKIFGLRQHKYKRSLLWPIFKKEEIFFWKKYKGYILRLILFNSPSEILLYFLKKWRLKLPCTIHTYI